MKGNKQLPSKEQKETIEWCIEQFQKSIERLDKIAGKEGTSETLKKKIISQKKQLLQNIETYGKARTDLSKLPGSFFDKPLIASREELRRYYSKPS